MENSQPSQYLSWRPGNEQIENGRLKLTVDTLLIYHKVGKLQ